MSETRVQASDRARAQPKQDSRRRVPSTDQNRTAPESPVGIQEPQYSYESLLDSDFSQNTFEHHAALLGDNRLSHPANARVRMQIAQRIQREYGNQYVQRLVKHIAGTRAQAAQTETQLIQPSNGNTQKAYQVARQSVEMTATTGQGPIRRQEEEEEAVQINRQEVSLNQPLSYEPISQAADGPERQDANGDSPIAISETHEGEDTIHRHSAYEHYLLGQLAPDKLASIPLVRDIPNMEKKKKQIEEKKQVASPKEINKLINDLEDAKSKKEEVQHTIEQEMDRLEKWMNDPEAVKVDSVEPGTVKKGEDGEWQVPYVVIPVRDNEQVVATYSEVNTLPDLFGNPEAMANTPKDKFLSLIQGVRQQSYIELDNLYQEMFGESRSDLKRRIFGIDTHTERDFEGAQGPRAQAVIAKAYEIRMESQVQSATKREGEESDAYFAALERNACHFAPYSWAQWESYHKKARDLALESWKSKDMADDIRELGGDESIAEGYEEEAADYSNKALLQNAFGEHYLQDSFAGGHLVDKTKIMQWFVQWLNSTGRALGTFKNAQAEWAMLSTIASRDLESNPQALDDKMKRGETTSMEEAAAVMGLKAEPRIIFMMWWRNAATADKKLKHLTPDVAAAKCALPEVKGNPEKAAEYMEGLVGENFAKIKKEGIIRRKSVYSLNQTMINTLQGGGPYDATVAKDAMISGEERDFTKEAHEFDVNALNSFLSNTFVQGATKFFHDKYCKEGLVVNSRGKVYINRIYGDRNMLKAGAQEGVKFSATTSKMSREAIFNIMNGKPGEADSVKDIGLRFPGYVIESEDEPPLALDKWNESLKAQGEKSLFKKAMNTGAKIVYKLQTSISGGHALDLEMLTKQAEAESDVPEHDEGPF